MRTRGNCHMRMHSHTGATPTATLRHNQPTGKGGPALQRRRPSGGYPAARAHNGAAPIFARHPQEPSPAPWPCQTNAGSFDSALFVLRLRRRPPRAGPVPRLFKRQPSERHIAGYLRVRGGRAWCARAGGGQEGESMGGRRGMWGKRGRVGQLWGGSVMDTRGATSPFWPGPAHRGDPATKR